MNTTVILYRIDPEKQMQRYYRMDVQPDLFGRWCLIREWGRIGQQARPAASPSLPRRKQKPCSTSSAWRRSERGMRSTSLRVQ